MLRYLLSRLITVGVTIALGVLITILLANRDGAVDQVVENDIRRGVEYRVASGQWGDISAGEAERRQQAMEESAGLHLPYIPRHLRWLGNALAFRWGEASARTSADINTYTTLSALMGPSYTRFRVTQIIATRLKNLPAFGLLSSRTTTARMTAMITVMSSVRVYETRMESTVTTRTASQPIVHLGLERMKPRARSVSWGMNVNVRVMATPP